MLRIYNFGFIIPRLIVKVVYRVLEMDGHFKAKYAFH